MIESINQSIVCAQRLIGGPLSLLHVTTNKNITKKLKHKCQCAECICELQESVPMKYKKAVLSQRWPHDVRYISRSWTVAEIWPFKSIQDGGGRHLEFVRIENSAIRSAVPEKNPTL